MPVDCANKQQDIYLLMYILMLKWKHFLQGEVMSLFIKRNKHLFKCVKFLSFFSLILLSIMSCGGGGSSSKSPEATTPSTEDPATPPVLPDDSIVQVDGRWVDTHSDALLAEFDESKGALVYGFYANEQQENRDHILPDFSYAGFKKGGVALPSYDSLTVQVTVSPIDGDNREQIQNAIDSVSALPIDEDGYRGVVLLSAGEYEVNGPLIVSASGVIIRGEGQGDDGTVLKATSTEYRSTLILFEGEGGGVLANAALSKSQTAINQTVVPVGSRRVQVSSVVGYSVGDEIAIVRTPNELWVGESGINTAQYGWEPDGYIIGFERTVTAIEGNTLVFDIPIVDTIESSFGGGYVYRIDVSERIQQVALENIQLQTLWSDDLTDENRAFYAIDLSEVQNSWVRDVTVKYFSHAYNIRYGSRFNTLQDIAFVEPNFKVTGGRHYGFNFDGGSFNLFQRCYAKKARHTFVSGSRVTGPNVYLDCSAEESATDSGPHHRWATGTLFDNTQGAELNVQNRQDSGSGHGWPGAQQLFWNSEHESYIFQTPPFAMNWAVGIIGEIAPGKWTDDEASGILQSYGAHVEVRSLYLQQLHERLGESAVEAITTSGQRAGNIWDSLKAWQGEGKFNAE